jgi:hypothetical protein
MFENQHYITQCFNSLEGEEKAFNWAPKLIAFQKEWLYGGESYLNLGCIDGWEDPSKGFFSVIDGFQAILGQCSQANSLFVTDAATTLSYNTDNKSFKAVRTRVRLRSVSHEELKITLLDLKALPPVFMGIEITNIFSECTNMRDDLNLDAVNISFDHWANSDPKLHAHLIDMSRGFYSNSRFRNAVICMKANKKCLKINELK